MTCWAVETRLDHGTGQSIEPFRAARWQQGCSSSDLQGAVCTVFWFTLGLCQSAATLLELTHSDLIIETMHACLLLDRTFNSPTHNDKRNSTRVKETQQTTLEMFLLFPSFFYRNLKCLLATAKKSFTLLAYPFALSHTPSSVAAGPCMSRAAWSLGLAPRAVLYSPVQGTIPS